METKPKAATYWTQEAVWWSGEQPHGRPHLGADGVSWPLPWKMDEKLKSENMQKVQQFSEYFESNQGRQM